VDFENGERAGEGDDQKNFFSDCAFFSFFFTKLHASYHKNKCKSKEMMVAAMQQAIFF